MDSPSEQRAFAKKAPRSMCYAITQMPRTNSLRCPTLKIQAIMVNYQKFSDVMREGLLYPRDAVISRSTLPEMARG